MQNCGHTSEWIGPRVERVMRNGKQLYVAAFKSWLVAQASAPGASVSAIALRNGVNANQLRHWMRLPHWREASLPAPAVLPVVVSDAVPSNETATPMTPMPRPAAVIEIRIGGAVVHVPAGVDARELRLVIAALRA